MALKTIAKAATAFAEKRKPKIPGEMSLWMISAKAVAQGSRSRVPQPNETLMAFQDIIDEQQDGIATIAINRPEVRNAFRGQPQTRWWSF